MVRKKVIVTLFIVLWPLSAIAEDYGDQWLYFIDDRNGSTHVMNFSSLPADNRGFILGDAYFYLYTRRNTQDAEELLIPKNSSLMNSTYFNASNDIRIITHGWLSGVDLDWVQNIKNRLLNVSDLNVILVDWSELAANPIYPWPALCTRYVGKRIAKLMEALSDSYQADSSGIYLIGHSLGAQVMGYAGMFYKKRVQRITGLDPARPLFELPDMGPRFRLDESDANMVDILHTCGGRLGYKYSHGHGDFYPNEGKSPQPGCEQQSLAIWKTDACSHGRSYEYFYESILKDVKFYAYPCQNWKTFERNECTTNRTLMGYFASMTETGDFYLRTRNESTYEIEEDS